MKHIYSFNLSGRWTPENDLVIPEEAEVPKGNFTDIAPPMPNWKPVFSGSLWVETATEEEKILVLSPATPSIEEQLEEEKAKVKRLETQLNQTNADLQGFMDFYFDNIAL